MNQEQIIWNNIVKYGGDLVYDFYGIEKDAGIGTAWNVLKGVAPQAWKALGWGAQAAGKAGTKVPGAAGGRLGGMWGKAKGMFGKGGPKAGTPPASPKVAPQQLALPGMEGAASTARGATGPGWLDKMVGPEYAGKLRGYGRGANKMLESPLGWAAFGGASEALGGGDIRDILKATAVGGVAGKAFGMAGKGLGKLKSFQKLPGWGRTVTGMGGGLVASDIAGKAFSPIARKITGARTPEQRMQQEYENQMMAQVKAMQAQGLLPPGEITPEMLQQMQG